jgi:hypothetical protein
MQGRLEMALYTILAIYPLVALLNGGKYLPGHGSPGLPQSYPLTTPWHTDVLMNS